MTYEWTLLGLHLIGEKLLCFKQMKGASMEFFAKCISTLMCIWYIYTICMQFTRKDCTHDWCNAQVKRKSRRLGGYPSITGLILFLQPFYYHFFESQDKLGCEFSFYKSFHFHGSCLDKSSTLFGPNMSCDLL